MTLVCKIYIEQKSLDMVCSCSFHTRTAGAKQGVLAVSACSIRSLLLLVSFSYLVPLANNANPVRIV
jgi:hypothetical protein